MTQNQRARQLTRQILAMTRATPETRRIRVGLRILAILGIQVTPETLGAATRVMVTEMKTPTRRTTGAVRPTATTPVTGEARDD